MCASQETAVNFDLKKDLAGQGPTPEQLKKYEEAKAANEKDHATSFVANQCQGIHHTLSFTWYN